MKHSDTIGELATAFAAFQKDVKNPVKTQSVDTGTFSYSFAPLTEILETVRPVLAENGLSVAQDLMSDDRGGLGCATLLLHSSGEWIAFSPVFVPAGADAREHGSAASYARRYSLMAALNLAAADDDAQAASSPAPRRQNPGSDKATQRQLGKIHVEATACGITEKQLHAAVKRDYGAESLKDITKDQAGQLIERLVEKHKAIDAAPAAPDPDEEQARDDLGDEEEPPGHDAESYRAANAAAKEGTPTDQIPL